MNEKFDRPNRSAVILIKVGLILIGLVLMIALFTPMRGTEQDRYTVLRDDGDWGVDILLDRGVPEEEIRAVAERAARTLVNTPGRKLFPKFYFWITVFRLDSAGDQRPHARLQWPTRHSPPGSTPLFFLVAGATREFDRRPSMSLLRPIACPQDPRVVDCLLDNLKEYVELTVSPTVPEAEAVRFSEEIARRVGNLAPTETFAVAVYRDARVESLLGEARYDPQTQSVSFKRFH